MSQSKKEVCSANQRITFFPKKYVVCMVGFSRNNTLLTWLKYEIFPSDIGLSILQRFIIFYYFPLLWSEIIRNCHFFSFIWYNDFTSKETFEAFISTWFNKFIQWWIDIYLHGNKLRIFTIAITYCYIFSYMDKRIYIHNKNKKVVWKFLILMKSNKMLKR